VKRDANASTAGSTMRRANGLGRIFRGAGVTRGDFGDGDGSGAPSRRPILFSFLATMLLAALFAAPAQAAPVTIAEFGKKAGQVWGPQGAALHRASGDLYIADRNNFRIDKFDSDGNFLLAWGFGVADGTTPAPQTCGPEATPPTSTCFSATSGAGAGSVAPEGVAVDQSSGAVYVSEGISRWRVSKFTPAGEFVFMVGRNVNETKVAEGGATQAEKNICTAASGDTCGAGEAGAGPNEFSAVIGENQFGLTSVAVDSAGVVWVGSVDRLSSFDASGAPGAEIALPGAGLTQSLAFDSADNFYVISESLAGVRKLEAGTGAPLETLDEANNPRTVTLDEDDNVYVGDETSPYRFKVYNPAGEQTAQFGAGQVIGAPGAGNEGGGNALAVDKETGTLYAASSSTSEAESVVQAFPLPEPGPLPENQHVTDLLPTTVTLAADLNPEGNETTYHFEYGTSDSYGQSTPTLTLPGTGFDSEAVEADLEELIPETTYHFRLVATNHCKPAEPLVECTVAGPDTTFTTLPAVGIEAQWATDVTATSAVLHAELDPLGVAAQWWIEYGTSESYGQSTAEGSLPATFGEIAVSTPFINLTPGTTYHYRFAARDERDGTTYTVHGADKTFITQASALGFELADDRAWEMVSPPSKFGALITLPSEGQIQAAADGNALAYLSAGSIEAAPEGNRVLEASSALARRDGAGGWHSRDITPPHTTVTPVPIGNGFEYKLFSPDLERALFEQRDTEPLSAEASERTPYLRENTEPGNYTPLVSGKEGFANVPPGTVFGGDPTSFLGAVGIVGASPDLSHVVLRARVALAAGADANGSLYEWEAGQLQQVSALPAGEGGATVGAKLGSGSASVRKAISDDGSRVFWSTPASGNPNALYVRDIDREETVRLDIVEPGSLGEGAANPVFQGANAEGTVAFFTDSHQLTEDANEKGRDLYRCEVTVEGGELGCDLTNLTAETGGAKESAEVQGLASGMSDDATRVYFVARGVLDSQPNGMGEGAVPGQPNLYLWREGGGTHFIATLSEEDENDWGSPNLNAYEISAAASPSGRYLSFMSQRSLTGYDNRDAKTDEPNQEVFRYDAAADELICASCNPSGASPVGLLGDGNSKSDPLGIWVGRSLAAVLPEAIGNLGISAPPLHRPRAVHDNGRLFFNAADALVPADSNGNWDVYQYEPTGTGDCTTSSGGASISRSAGGCVSLISSGTSEEESAFLDASVGGDDVFFLTSAQLSVTDEDEEVDVYDARVNGIPATLAPNAECLGEACQPAANAPNDPTPASASFKGAGNQKPRKAIRRRCAKGKRAVTRKGKSRCVPRKHKRNRAKHRANRNRGARR
jgi:hypothetical protein